VRSERGQAAVEWVGLVLLCAVALGAVAGVAPAPDGRSFGGFLAHRIVCAVKGGCDDGDLELARAYGPRDAELVRRYAPGLVYEPGEKQLPVDWRRCRDTDCANAPDDRDLDVQRTDSGGRATVFTRVVRRRGRLYIQYWFYYPDSNTTLAGSDKIWGRSPVAQLVTRLATGKAGYPGFHLDDWEGHEVRVDRDGRVSVRSTTHGGWQWCKSGCKGKWGPRTGWTRVSRGSHSGHVPTRWGLVPMIPGRGLRERTTTAEGLRLVPLERVRRGRYRPLSKGIDPPWRKRAWNDPATPES
jgi:hypothetical protein